MHFTTLAAAASLLCVSQAAETHVLNAGQNGTIYKPDKITANVGDMIQVQFLGGNHTVTQSNFDNPCVPISRSGNSSTEAISSGFQPAAASMAKGEVPVFTFMVKDTKPMWFYCAQGKHCQGGMSFVVNENPSANQSRTLDNYKKLAEKAESSSGGNTGTSGGRTGNEPPVKVNGASSNFVAVPATMLLALGSAFMLL